MDTNTLRETLEARLDVLKGIESAKAACERAEEELREQLKKGLEIGLDRQALIKSMGMTPSRFSQLLDPEEWAKRQEEARKKRAEAKEEKESKNDHPAGF